MNKCFMILGMLLVSQGSAADIQTVAGAMAEGDFKPYVMLESQAIRELGRGSVNLIDGDVLRAYRGRDCDMKITVRIDGDASPEYRTVREITVEKLRGARDIASSRADICNLRLAGTQIGESLKAVMKTFEFRDEDLRQDVLSGEKLDSVTVFPRRKGGEIYYKFYFSNRKLVAFAMGVTE